MRAIGSFLGATPSPTSNPSIDGASSSCLQCYQIQSFPIARQHTGGPVGAHGAQGCGRGGYSCKWSVRLACSSLALSASIDWTVQPMKLSPSLAQVPRESVLLKR